jgi:hypothetical protein
MPDERIEVEWIATANKMVQVLDRMDTRFDKQEKQLQKLAQTSDKTANAAAGSFNKLEQELKENELALRKMEIGTKEFEEQRKKVDALRASLQKAKAELTVSKEESPWPAIGSTMTAAAASAGVLAAALIRVSQAQREIVSKGADQAMTIDTLSRQMQIQSGLNDQERESQMVEIVRQSSQAGVQADVGFRAATQLAGSGFADAVDSGTLTTILDTMQASSFKGEPEELVSAFAQALNAYGLEKTNDNLQAIAVASQSLFKQTDFQLTELSDFAKNASVFEGANIKIDEALAGFTALREVLPAAESGTGLRNFVNKLQAGDLTAENAANLQRIGVDAGQVDFVGESLTDVLSTIRDATAQMGEADRNAALGKMFGTENVASARLLLQSVDRIKELQASQQDPAQFRRDRDTAASGIQASRNRIENQQLLDMVPIAGRISELDLRNRAMDSEIKAQQERLVAGGGASALLAPLVPTASQATDVVARTRDETAGGRIGIGAIGETVSPGTGYLVNKLLDIFAQQRDEQIATRLAIQNLAPQQPIVRVQAPAARPKEAPLPATTTP